MGALSKLLKVGIKAAERAAPRAAEEDAAKLAVKKAARKALPAPEKRLALPAPDPARDTSYAAVLKRSFKPKGGQWVADHAIVGGNDSPEAAARHVAARFREDAPALHDWAVKALPRYVKRDANTESDPLLALAAQGRVPGVDSPEAWGEMIADSVGADAADYYQGLHQLFGQTPAEVARQRKTDDFLRSVDQHMPWVHKMPSTDPVYAMYGDDPLDLPPITHTLDELHNALRAGSDLPPNLQLDESTLQRMSFPQGVERAGLIDKWRAAQMEAERANIVASNPAFAVHKEYPDDPRGLRWMQIKLPGGLNYDEGGNLPGYDDLAAALKNEGDAMGHCVGGYCHSVAQGDSSIYTLRDAKGEPHVTIETAPAHLVYSDIAKRIGDEQSMRWLNEGLTLNDMVERAGGREALGLPVSNVVQIKGKQNAKPVADYIPYVQDFLRSRKWGEIGDAPNADLVRLPDNRHAPRDALQQAIDAYMKDRVLGNATESNKTLVDSIVQYGPNMLAPRVWEQLLPNIEGFKRGGFVVKRKAACDCGCSGFAVKGTCK